MINITNFKKIKNFTINFGPQHPAAHGVLRLIIELNGENIINCDPHIGLLHRGTEKLIEYKNYNNSIPYFDRLDYVSMMSQEHCFVLSIENLLNLNIPIRAKFIRVIFIELTRILNHLLGLTTHAMDVGALTPFLWIMEEREKIMEFYERVSGARMHSSYFKIGGLNYDLPLNLLNDIYYFIKNFNVKIVELEEVLTKNRIWKQRLVDIGIVSAYNALKFGLSGVMLRGSGLKFDLRKNNSYEIYNKIDFNIPIGKNGDCFDRFNVRIIELKESIKIIYFCLNNIPTGNIKLNNYKFNSTSKLNLKNSMESLISHFKYYTEGVLVPFGEFYTNIEAPKGEFGIYINSNNTNKPNRVRIKAPGFLNLQLLNSISQKHLIADVVTIIGTIDVVFGEVDR